MATIYHQVWVNAPVEKVYAALTSAEAIGTWWDKQTPVQTDEGLVLEHNPGPEHGVVKLRVVKQLPDKRIEWECVSMHPQSSPAFGWPGTHIMFDLSARKAPTWMGGAETMCVVDFHQTNYSDISPFFGFNNFTWALILQNLKQAVEAAPS
ncbi:MAG: SRPBCC domain-containing protein [Betaproteobacteria bacterium]|nr:SRPBCC domain-containing protein [Betaproteobacteria bacterium]